MDHNSLDPLEQPRICVNVNLLFAKVEVKTGVVVGDPKEKIF